MNSELAANLRNVFEQLGQASSVAGKGQVHSSMVLRSTLNQVVEDPAALLIPVSSNNQTSSSASQFNGQPKGQSSSDQRPVLSVASRRVQINGNVCLDSARRLKAGDVVKLLEQSVQKPPEQEDVKIRYLDGHVVVIEKPAGVTTLRHPEEGDWPERRHVLSMAQLNRLPTQNPANSSE